MAQVLTSFSLALSTVGVTVDTALSSASVDTVRFPLSNTTIKTKPLRVGRIAAPSSPTIANNGFAIYYNVPPGTTISGAFVDNCNFIGNVYFQSTNTIGAGVTNITLQSGQTLAKDPRTKRIKSYVRFASSIYFDGITKAKIKISTNGGTIDSAYGTADVSIGTVAFFEPDKEISYPGGFINDIEYEVIVPTVKSSFDTGSYENVEIGETYITISVPPRTFYETQEFEYLNLILNKTTPFIFWENEGDSSRAYVVKLDNNISKLDYKVRGKAFEASLSFIELI